MKAIVRNAIGMVAVIAIILVVFIRGRPSIGDSPLHAYEYVIPVNVMSGIVEARPIEKINSDALVLSSQKAPITIVIPYRNRRVHYRRLMEHLKRHPQRARMRVIVVEQNDPEPFRRGWLLNIGILESGRQADECIVTHDVDIFVSYAADYGDCVIPSTPCSLYNGKKWPTLAGGVVTASLGIWIEANGYTNLAYGWGGEDDCLFHRFLQKGLLPKGQIRRSMEKEMMCSSLNDGDHTVRYKNNHRRHLAQFHRLEKGSREWKADGLNSIRYTVLSQSTDEYGTLWLNVTDAKDRRYPNLFNTRYINLESRKDRRALIEAELARTGVCCAERVDAVSFPKKDRTSRWGAMGCAVSHMRALASTRAPVAFILEDDALFQRQPPLIELETPSFLWHVLLFAYNGGVDNARCVVAHGNRWCRVLDAQTTSMYAVRKTYIPQLLHVFNESFRGLSLGKPVPEFAIDRKWKELQRQENHFWYAAVPRIGIQRPSYSNIEGTKVNYGV